jgi:hypothetical protein
MGPSPSNPNVPSNPGFVTQLYAGPCALLVPRTFLPCLLRACFKTAFQTLVCPIWFCHV